VLTHFIGFQNDISARLEKERVDLLIEKMERDIALSTLEDERLEKLNRIKDEFIAVASKQLHEPVVSVAASLKILATTMDTLSTPQKDALQRAIRENEKQQAVIEELLSVAQLDSGKVVLHKRLTDVHEAMNASEASLLEIDPQLTISKVDEPVLVRIDAGILETALCHLVSAAKAYAKGHRALVLTADANTVRIYVIAHGVSIDSVTREQLFNTFSSPKTDIAEQHTLGLGLYWVKTIAALHNGTVEISDESQPDLTFRLSLARIEADA
jgi:K+-sensing histidine kinase KdpD